LILSFTSAFAPFVFFFALFVVIFRSIH